MALGTAHELHAKRDAALRRRDRPRHDPAVVLCDVGDLCVRVHPSKLEKLFALADKWDEGLPSQSLERAEYADHDTAAAARPPPARHDAPQEDPAATFDFLALSALTAFAVLCVVASLRGRRRRRRSRNPPPTSRPSPPTQTIQTLPPPQRKVRKAPAVASKPRAPNKPTVQREKVVVPKEKVRQPKKPAPKKPPVAVSPVPEPNSPMPVRTGLTVTVPGPAQTAGPAIWTGIDEIPHHPDISIRQEVQETASTPRGAESTPGVSSPPTVSASSSAADPAASTEGTVDEADGNVCADIGELRDDTPAPADDDGAVDDAAAAAAAAAGEDSQQAAAPSRRRKRALLRQLANSAPLPKWEVAGSRQRAKKAAKSFEKPAAQPRLKAAPTAPEPIAERCAKQQTEPGDEAVREVPAAAAPEANSAVEAEASPAREAEGSPVAECLRRPVPQWDEILRCSPLSTAAPPWFRSEATRPSRFARHRAAHLPSALAPPHILSASAPVWQRSTPEEVPLQHAGCPQPQFYGEQFKARSCPIAQDRHAPAYGGNGGLPPPTHVSGTEGTFPFSHEVSTGGQDVWAPVGWPGQSWADDVYEPAH